VTVENSNYQRPVILDQISLHEHAIIEASAGTGKTYTIEHIVVDLLLRTECTIDQLLVMTFTDKATVELRARIRDTLEKVLRASAAHGAPTGNTHNIDDAGRRKIEDALFAFDSAPICTIHAFCQRILSELAFESGTGFDLTVIEGRYAFHRAFRETLREHFALDETARELLEEWLAQDVSAHQNLTDALEALLYEAHNHRYLATENNRPDPHAVTQLFKLFDHNLLKAAYGKRKGSPGENGQIFSNQVAELKKQHSKSPRAFEKAFAEIDMSRVPDAESFASLKSQTFSRETIALLEVIDAARVATCLEARVVDAFLQAVCDRMQRDKREKGEIDYDDMLAWVSDALEGSRGPALTAALRSRYSYAIVDEFQDTDDRQWNILRGLFLTAEGANFLYVVGDPKQAIYGFRAADVFTYLAAKKELRDHDAAEVPLVENHRSTASLIEACNCIFDQNAPATIFTGEIKFEHPAVCGRPEMRAMVGDRAPVVPVSILRYVPPEGGKGYVPRMRAAIGRNIAAKIREILFDEKRRITVTDDDGSSRAVSARDIYILTRTKFESLEIGGYLRQAGVPYAFYKQEGLFQSSEASDIVDVLKAIAQPDSKSARIKAWASPFFAVPFADLFTIGDLSFGQPLSERLFQWRALAQDEHYTELFDRLLHQTGLVNRELFLSNSERELTNYLHIFELLIEEASREKLSFQEIIERLELFIAEVSLPAKLNANVQRIESERHAVQIMSVHMSKGLQAHVVFLFGGLTKPPDFSKVAVYHEGSERRVVVGKPAKELAGEILKREQREENQRLIYVAVTRARSKLYLSIFPEGSTHRKLYGYYEQLNDRLNVLASGIEGGTVKPGLFEIVEVNDRRHRGAGAAADLSILAKWSPPEKLLHDVGCSKISFNSLRREHAALLTRSYTALESRAADRRAADSFEVEEFKYDLDTSSDAADLRGGRQVGIFLHEVIEKLELKSFEQSSDFGSWSAREDVTRLFADTMRRHQVTDQRWTARGMEIVFNSLTASIATEQGGLLGPLYKCSNAREMEFVYPIPEHSHPLLQSILSGEWSVERGYLRGVVDFVFEQNGKHYFADWKSDLLPSYERDALAAHVKDHYDLQARIYSVGVVRLLQIRNRAEYEQRFGGLLYLFIRGIKPDGAGEDGVYFHRPSWDEICLYERDLIASVPALVQAE
jgi:exodeoxyribonuclease V beta subunit